jgi:DNA-binding HxlR family transcriptional regulator
VKQRRLLKRMTLLVIAELLQSDRPRTHRQLADAASVSSRALSQILKRLRSEGWLTHDMKPGFEAPRTRGSRRRFRLTPEGRRDAKRALQKQGRLAGGKWCLNEGGEIPMRVQQPRRSPIDVARRYLSTARHFECKDLMDGGCRRRLHNVSRHYRRTS